MANSHLNIFRFLKRKVVESNLKFWNESKIRMEEYATAMSEMSTPLKILTPALPPETRAFSFPKLQHTLFIPLSLNINTAMD